MSEPGFMLQVTELQTCGACPAVGGTACVLAL